MCVFVCFHSVWGTCVTVGTPGTGVSSGYDISALTPLMEPAFINVVSAPYPTYMPRYFRN